MCGSSATGSTGCACDDTHSLYMYLAMQILLICQCKKCAVYRDKKINDYCALNDIQFYLSVILDADKSRKILLFIQKYILPVGYHLQASKFLRLIMFTN